MKTLVHFCESSSLAARLRPLLCFLPGGPGLSSNTLRSMQRLTRSFDLLFIDPPGTGKQPDVVAPNFSEVLASIVEALGAFQERPLALVGHSFGAFYAIELAHSGKFAVQSIQCLASPLTLETYGFARIAYQKLLTQEIAQASAAFSQNPSRETVNSLWASSSSLYFAQENQRAGRELLLRDESSAASMLHLLKVFTGNPQQIDFCERLLALPLPKFLVAGMDDALFPPEQLALDAKRSGSEFQAVAKAAHFLSFDQPEAVARLIENFTIDSKKGTL